MHYVLAPDGARYGPADLPTLNDWIATGRLAPTSTLEDAATGAKLPAVGLPGLDFALPPPPYPPQTLAPTPIYAPADYGPMYPLAKTTGGSSRLYGSIAVALFALVSAPFVSLFPLLVAGHAVAMAFRAKDRDRHPLGGLAVALTIGLAFATFLLAFTRPFRR